MIKEEEKALHDTTEAAPHRKEEKRETKVIWGGGNAAA